MNRRTALGLLGSVGAFGISGLSVSGLTDRGDENSTVTFAGVIVESLPMAERHQPLDVTVAVKKDGTERYRETHTVENVVYDEAFRVTEPWMDEQGAYTVTVSTPVHDSNTYSTAQLAESDRQDKFTNETVYFRFQLTEHSILFRPTPMRSK